MLELLNNCNENNFSKVYKHLKIVTTLPFVVIAVEVAEESSFSKLRHLKTYLRNTMSENCFTRLAQIFIEKLKLIQMKC